MVSCSTWDVLGTRADHCSRADPDTRGLAALEAWLQVVQGAKLDGNSAQGSRVARTAQPRVGNHRNLVDDFAKREVDSGVDYAGFVESYLHSGLVLFDFLK